MVMELPLVLVFSVLIGGGGGFLIDRWLHSSPAATLLGGLLGFAGGMWQIVRRLASNERKGA
jgi:F0F1-type ATP synthase assembly protein I